MSYFARIKPKMLLSLLATFTVVLGAFLVLVIIRTTDVADGMAEELSLATAEGYANQMAAVLNKTDNLVLGLKLAAEQFADIPAENRRTYLDGLLEQAVAAPLSDITGAFFCFEPDALDGMDSQYRESAESDGTGRYVTYFFADGAGVSRDVVKAYDVPGEGDYYLVSFNTGKAYVTPPYSFDVNGVMVTGITISYPLLNRDGVTVGVAGVDYAMDYFDTLNDEVKLYDTGFGKFFTDQGLTVAHPDKSLIQTIDLDWTESTEAPAIKATLQFGKPYVGKIYSPVLDTSTYKAFANVPMGNSGINWVYGVVVPEAEVMATTTQLVMLISIIGGIGLLVAAVIIVLLANSVARPVRRMCEVAEQIADCDLTVDIPDKLLNGKDEMGELSRNLKRMRDGLSETVSGINNVSASLHGQVDNVQAAIRELNGRISDTSAATEELSASMEETGASAEEMNATASEIEHAIELVSDKSEEGAGRSQEIHIRAESLGKNVGESIEKSNRIFLEIKQALEKALADSKAVDEINALADAILGIASQTTLLALNASIEAARAGEAGKGFAVVANEISTLADNSKNTVSQIQAITKVVMNAVNALAGSSTNLLNFVADNVQSDYQDMVKAAESYTNDAVYISDMTSDLNAASEELRASVQIMMKSINEVSQAAQEGSRTTTAVAEQTGEISGNAASMAENMDRTQGTAAKLTELIRKFRL